MTWTYKPYWTGIWTYFGFFFFASNLIFFLHRGKEIPQAFWLPSHGGISYPGGGGVRREIPHQQGPPHHQPRPRVHQVLRTCKVRLHTFFLLLQLYIFALFICCMISLIKLAQKIFWYSKWEVVWNVQRQT